MGTFKISAKWHSQTFEKNTLNGHILPTNKNDTTKVLGIEYELVSPIPIKIQNIVLVMLNYESLMIQPNMTINVIKFIR